MDIHRNKTKNKACKRLLPDRSSQSPDGGFPQPTFLHTCIALAICQKKPVWVMERWLVAHPAGTKQKIMKTMKFTSAALLTAASLLFVSFAHRNKPNQKISRPYPAGCVFKTVMGEEASDSMFRFKTPERVQLSLSRGLNWLALAQNPDGGWGAGSHYRQDVMDPHAVASDPATTAMVAMALLRSGHTPHTGEHRQRLTKALNYLLQAVESAPLQSNNITSLTGTQIQTKLGANIDVVLTSQFFSNLLDGHLQNDASLRHRVKQANEICVTKIQRAQQRDGSTAGSGWAGVLQSSFATNALEAAEAQGAAVDKKTLDQARAFQKNNFNAQTGDVNTDLGAGIVLYSVSGSTRASAKEARAAAEAVEEAKRQGRLQPEAAPSASVLEKLGFAKDEALKYATAYEVYNKAKIQAQRDDVMEGFGNNGGEEFLSYLQTGESMVIGKDHTWQQWYDNMSGRLLKIQNNNGSWSGHHCITSPVFCTATCLLILSVNQDVDKLMNLGKG
jgi:hypothetical protein